MSTNTEKLRELKDDLQSVERVHSEILGKEPFIARAVHQAADETRRRLNQVTEASAPSTGFVS